MPRRCAPRNDKFDGLKRSFLPCHCEACKAAAILGKLVPDCTSQRLPRRCAPRNDKLRGADFCQLPLQSVKKVRLILVLQQNACAEYGFSLGEKLAAKPTDEGPRKRQKWQYHYICGTSCRPLIRHLLAQMPPSPPGGRLALIQLRTLVF